MNLHGPVSDGRAEDGTVPIHVMVGAARSGYPGDNGRGMHQWRGKEETGAEELEA